MAKNLSSEELAKLTEKELDSLLEKRQISLDEWLEFRNNGKDLSKILAEAVVDVFEETLDFFEIDLPSEDRTGLRSDCRIYGDVYGDMIDEIVSILKDYVDK